jgi:hypothetical protein
LADRSITLVLLQFMTAVLLWNASRPKRWLVYRIAFASLALFLLSSCQGIDQRTSALVLAVEGEAHASFEAGRFSLTIGSPLRPGTLIEVSPGSRLDLLLLPGIRVELAAGSRAQIGPLRLARDGDETIEPMTTREATLNLTHGALLGSIGRVQTRSRLHVTMPLGTLSAGSGRLFQLRATENQVRVV